MFTELYNCSLQSQDIMSSAWIIYVVPLVILFFGRCISDFIWINYALSLETVQLLRDKNIQQRPAGLCTLFVFLIMTCSSYFNVLFHYQHYELWLLTTHGAVLSLGIWGTFDITLYLIKDEWNFRLMCADILYGVASNTVLIFFCAWILRGNQ